MTEAQTRQSLCDVIRAEIDHFTKSEKRVARVLLAGYPVAGLQTVAELANNSSVSGQTVIRFVARLGFDSYPAFQQRLKDELKVRGEPPLARFSSAKGEFSGNAAEASFHLLQDALAKTSNALPAAEFDETVELLTDNKRSLLVTGGRSSQLVAQYLCIQVQQMRNRVQFLSEDSVVRAHGLMDAGRKPVVMIYDTRRYSEQSYKFAEAAAKKGATIVLVTDPYLSPISQLAHIVLPVQIDFPTPFDSLTAAVGLTESLVAAISTQIDARVEGHMTNYEALRSYLD